jgi:hypothetical protein
MGMPLRYVTRPRLDSGTRLVLLACIESYQPGRMHDPSIPY